MRIFGLLATLLAMSAVLCPLQAYTDPGSGLLLWQSLVGGFLGISFLFRKHLGRFFQRETPSDPAIEKSTEGSARGAGSEE
jgi:hypothetical protein